MRDLWEQKLGLTLIGMAVVFGLFITACPAKGEERMATTQSAKPWTIAQCDRLMGVRVTAVFNTGLYSHTGWPLWRVVCYLQAPAEE